MKALEVIKRMVKLNGGVTITPNGKKAELTNGYMVAVEKFNKNLQTIEELTIHDLKEALKMGRSENQEAIFDNKNKRCIFCQK